MGPAPAYPEDRVTFEPHGPIDRAVRTASKRGFGTDGGDMKVLLVNPTRVIPESHRSARHDDVTKERTLAMIKPDGLFGNHSDKIKDIILESGFNILKDIMIQLDESNVTLFYAEHSAKSFFPRLIEYMTSGPVLVMVLEKSNAISEWRALIGPTDPTEAKIFHPNSIRAMCGTDIERNCVHGSDSSWSASKEISFFFGEMMLSGFSDNLKHDEL